MKRAGLDTVRFKGWHDIRGYFIKKITRKSEKRIDNLLISVYS